MIRRPSVDNYLTALDLFNKIVDKRLDTEERCTVLIQVTVAWACSENPDLHESLANFYQILINAEFPEDCDYDIKTSALALKIERVPATAVDSYRALRANILKGISTSSYFDRERIDKYMRLYNLKDNTQVKRPLSALEANIEEALKRNFRRPSIGELAGASDDIMCYIKDWLDDNGITFKE